MGCSRVPFGRSFKTNKQTSLLPQPLRLKSEVHMIGIHRPHTSCWTDCTMSGNYPLKINTTNSFTTKSSSWFHNNFGKKYTSGPRCWNVPVSMNTGTFLLCQYCPKMWYLCSLDRAGGIQKQTILEHQNGLVLSNTRVPVSGTWSILFPNFDMQTICIVTYFILISTNTNQT